ncbi:MAG TPA: glycosyltransferase [Conexibacter sp.]|nr:glycosyltransferase [Conexibacter sp.]
MRACGKFLYAGDEKLYLRGVTYGTFRDAADGAQVPPRHVVAADFAAMAASGVNTVRVYTVPPTWLLDLAAEHRLRVLVGIPWEQHVAFLADAGRQRAIVRGVRRAVRACAGHPAVLGYVVGNEIPPGIVRWHGRQRVERFIERLCRAAKAEDPHALVTYASYPSTEFLHLPFLDFVCFNVFLEDADALRRYLARLHALAGDRPLVIGELGLDSRRNGRDAQAASLAGQLRTAYAAGCAGACVFSWTDEWHRGGHDVEDWDFGVVDRARAPKPALAALRDAFAHVPFAPDLRWPAASVVVCTYNGSASIEDCVRAVRALDYPDAELIVVDDGSTDGAGERAAALGARVIRTENRGLSAARNTGTAAAAGEVVAFCDDDCMPDPHWLRHLVAALLAGDDAGVGGPNVPPPDVLVADSVGHAPGGPMHVLLSETEAEHIPGCNMAFRRAALERVGGFDPRFRVAGDDVDLCWRIQDAGGTLGFAPGALVWHRARRSVGAYLRQQAGYGRAEALLERKWPERYNGHGHVSWSGTVYGGKVRRCFGRRRWRVYHGTSGGGLFQSVYDRRGGGASAFPLAPEWHLVLLALAGAALVGVPLARVLFAACLLAIAAQAAGWALSVVLPASLSRRRRLGIRALVFALCTLQPVARLWGRMDHGLTPWRRRGPRVLALPLPRRASVWSERWRPAEDWVAWLDGAVRREQAQAARGGDFDTWDLEVRVGPLACARVRVAVEEHGEGRQMMRLRAWPRCSPHAAALAAGLAALTAWAAALGALAAACLLGAAAAWLLAGMATQAATAVVLPARAVAALGERSADAPVRAAPALAPEPSGEGA